MIEQPLPRELRLEIGQKILRAASDRMREAGEKISVTMEVGTDDGYKIWLDGGSLLFLHGDEAEALMAFGWTRDSAGVWRF